MPINQALIAEMEFENAITRKFLERYPEDKPEWRPHPKSYTLQRLTSHIAELVTWTGLTLKYPELDFATFNYKPVICDTTAGLIAEFEKNATQAIEDLKNAPDEVFMENWTMRMGEKIYFSMPKLIVLRNFVFNHRVHHRAQLSVYYRMLDIPVPQAYGPTADEK